MIKIFFFRFPLVFFPYFRGIANKKLIRLGRSFSRTKTSTLSLPSPHRHAYGIRKLRYFFKKILLNNNDKLAYLDVWPLHVCEEVFVLCIIPRRGGPTLSTNHITCMHTYIYEYVHILHRSCVFGQRLMAVFFFWDTLFLLWNRYQPQHLCFYSRI